MKELRLVSWTKLLVLHAHLLREAKQISGLGIAFWQTPSILKDFIMSQLPINSSMPFSLNQPFGHILKHGIFMSFFLQVTDSQISSRLHLYFMSEELS